MSDIKEELKKLPESPGVYIMHDASDNIIYVGKAVNLKRRVSSYFQQKPRSPKIEKMISLIDHFEYIMVESEMEAFVLECNLIKENRPKYNTMLMDDKTYPFVKVTVSEKYPRVFLTRHHERDKEKYFGPYTNVASVRDILKMFKKLYGYRTCGKKIDGTGTERPCLYFEVGECLGPCSGKVDETEYRKGIDEIMRFFEGDYSSVKKSLKEKMLKCSEDLEFEKAANYRDMLSHVEQLSQTQRVTASDDMNRDVVGIALKDYAAVVQVFFIRSGKMVGREHYFIDSESDDKSDVLSEFVRQFYGGAAVIPKEILLSCDISQTELVSDWLTERAGTKVKLTAPQKGKKEKLVELAVDNAENLLNKDLDKLKKEAQRTTGAVEELGELLGIEPPVRIESYDISNTAGIDSVGSMVVYENGRPKKSDYRRFRIRTVSGPDDYASMKEVLSRRFAHDDFKLPDLILMDGGKGQVNVALEAAGQFGIDIKICGMVKDDRHRTRGIYFQNEELPIDTGSECFKLITRIQDETHRFAIEYHKQLRSKTQTRSVLDDIPGIGGTRRINLIKHFETISGIKEASVEELAKAPGMNMKAAKAVYAFFHKEPDTVPKEQEDVNGI